MKVLLERYIGDGVYASFDGYSVWLKTHRDEGPHFMALEPEVYDTLIAASWWIERSEKFSLNGIGPIRIIMRD